MIDICLATYNGAKFIEAQLNSIVDQSYTDWHLWVRDDGSTDSTITILKKIQTEYVDKITLITDLKGNLGYNANFLEILQYTSSDYIAFCDQDDIWLPEKLEYLYEEIQRIEGTEKFVPVIVHSDFNYIKHGYIYPKENSLKKRVLNNRNTLKIILHQGCLLGCTCLINKAMIGSANDFPKNSSIGYDIYFLAVASIVGKYSYVNKILIHHQIHDSNTSSVGKRSKFVILLWKVFKLDVSSLAAQKIVAEKLLRQYAEFMQPQVKMALTSVVNLNSLNLFQRVHLCFKNGLLTLSLNGIVTLLRFLLNKQK